ncbi:TIGR03086 family metal-binding protein [Pseudarthrobacter sp. RMG13]|uniref:TIGR03086 family metal-binding protein n=1 Tax=Pseudarthrobacter humi TaxID=2952523 RepID=A0ABT1LR18_9MICC|nr:TIGR03086 family metal-binding protein [Pseudarthrobacter humi]MCP9000411.1 TIGR03086 family metal-binding protein [Pseudarthrobacter humi]
MTIDKSVFIPVDPDTAFALITRPERLRRWQAVAARVDLRVGGEYRWTITPGHSAAGTFTEIEPGKRVVFTWDWEGSTAPAADASTVTITLDSVDGGTNVRLVHEGLSPEAAAGHTEGWNHYFERLVTLASTDDAGADDWAAAPDPLTELVSAEATLAIVQRVLRTLTHGDADKPTPCEDFTVAELVEHLVGSITGIGKALGVAVVDQPDAAPEVRVADAAQPTLEAFQARGLEGTVDMGFAELPASMVANILNLEFLVHAWDFATATGQDLDVSPVLSDYVLGLAHNTISPQMRGKSFADETLVEESAASMDRLVAFTGRRVMAN